MVSIPNPDYKAARLIFCAGALCCLAIVVVWGMTTHESIFLRFLLVTLFSGLMAASAVEALRWVTKKEDVAKAGQAVQSEQFESKASSVEPKPDVTMRLVFPERPALLLENNSDATATQIKYTVALLNIDGPDVGKPAQIPIATFDFIKGHEKGGPQNLFDPPQIAKTPNKGQKLFGWIQISCPSCIKTHYYWAYIHFGLSGWYSEVPMERHEAIAKWLSDNGPYTDASVDKILSIIPVRDRIEIKPR